MGIRYLKKHAAFDDVVGVDDAETLLQWLRAQSRPAVHLGRCAHVHAAVLQVLLAVRPKIVALPDDAVLAAALQPACGAAAPC